MTRVWDTKINKMLIQTYNVLELRRQVLCEIEQSRSRYVRHESVLSLARTEIEQAEKAHEQACTIARRNGYQIEDIAAVLAQYKRSRKVKS